MTVVNADREQRRFETRDGWRSWLAENHDTAKEIWLVFYKKHAGKAGLTYVEALEEALCFGWIDGILKRIDEEKHTIRFSPRKKNSIWSQQNKKRVGKLIREGRMTEAGLAKVSEAKINGQWDKATLREDTTLVPPEFEAALAECGKARENFEKLAPCYRKQFIYWIGIAKRDETRYNRVKGAIGLLARNKRLGME
jgi:uncharacterized protein YdeI (YjbR/CyaY-like superfamily)